MPLILLLAAMFLCGCALTAHPLTGISSASTPWARRHIATGCLVLAGLLGAVVAIYRIVHG